VSYAASNAKQVVWYRFLVFIVKLPVVVLYSREGEEREMGDYQ